MYLIDFDSSHAVAAAEMSMNLADADVMTDTVNVVMIESPSVLSCGIVITLLHSLGTVQNGSTFHVVGWSRFGILQLLHCWCLLLGCFIIIFPALMDNM